MSKYRVTSSFNTRVGDTFAAWKPFAVVYGYTGSPYAEFFKTRGEALKRAEELNNQ